MKSRSSRLHNSTSLFFVALLTIACGKEVDQTAFENFLTDNGTDGGGDTVATLLPDVDMCGNLYDLADYRDEYMQIHGTGSNSVVLPNFETLEPFAGIKVQMFDFAPASWEVGFPIIPFGMTEWPASLLEWYGMSFEGKIQVPETGYWSFAIHSDDGAKFYIDGHLVVDNDGVHAPATSNGGLILEEGEHLFKMDYFQGPKVKIALELIWQHPGSTDWEYVPAENLSGWCWSDAE